MSLQVRWKFFRLCPQPSFRPGDLSATPRPSGGCPFPGMTQDGEGGQRNVFELPAALCPGGAAVGTWWGHGSTCP